MSKAALNDVILRGVAARQDGTRELPGAVVMATDLKKQLNYSVASGVRTLDPNGEQVLGEDGVFFMASMTKLMTSVAAMQTVERGLIGLDDDVSTVLHEWKDAQILESFDDSGKPIFRKAKNKITLRLLLCHSSGIGYDLMDPRLIQWRKSRGEEQLTLSGSIDGGYLVPLIFEPGEGWAYGAGIDWAGRLVERLNGSVRLGEYMKEHIWGPLGMTSTTFNIEAGDLKSRLVDMTWRQPTGEISFFPDPVYPRDAQDDCGGVGSYSSCSDYLKLLTSLVKGDGKLLKTSTIEEMFRPQLPNPKFLQEMVQIPEMRQVLAGNFPQGTKVDYALGGILNMDALPTGRSAGSMQWGGMPNLFWWMDRENGVCGVYCSQLMPTGDAASLKLLMEFEKAFYEGK